MAARKKTSSKSAPVQSGGVDFKDMEALAEFMSQHGLEEFEYERGDLHVRLRKGAVAPRGFSRAVAPPEIVVAASGSLPHGSASGAHESGEEPKPNEIAADAGRGEDLHVIKSPIVGTYYGAPSPGAEPFVKVGDTVKSGQVLCIIEAMKLMNEIESDTDGELARIFVENGQPVEYGESLFGIRPRRKR
jgi:acetyl-CoA carboxylase biotin carboxyl carrier protein